ncbi:MAG: FAD:protein FMN transferase, partial [Pseudomonadota bacterium]
MGDPAHSTRQHRSIIRFLTLFGAFATLLACHQRVTEKASELADAARSSTALASAASALPSNPPSPAHPALSPGPQAASPAASAPERVDFQDVAMGTNVHFIAYTNARADAEHVKAAISASVTEMRRLEELMSEWKSDSEVGKINANPEHWVTVGPQTFEVISRALAESRASGGAFDITFQAMSGLWKFGSAADAVPELPTPAEVADRRKLVDYRTVELDSKALAVRIPKAHKIGLGGIAKGYIVDRAVAVMKLAGIDCFLVQAGGDLYGAGKKPDGSAWISGIQDPRQAEGAYFATIELVDHAFSTAGDYARSYVIGKRRYHHIIDPHTGYPATASRSVTVWAEDATTADAIDDAVFILGPEKGLKLVEATPGVGVVIVDKNNKVWISPRIAG